MQGALASHWLDVFDNRYIWPLTNPALDEEDTKQQDTPVYSKSDSYRSMVAKLLNLNYRRTLSIIRQEFIFCDINF